MQIPLTVTALSLQWGFVWLVRKAPWLRGSCLLQEDSEAEAGGVPLAGGQPTLPGKRLLQKSKE